MVQWLIPLQAFLSRAAGIGIAAELDVPSTCCASCPWRCGEDQIVTRYPNGPDDCDRVIDPPGLYVRTRAFSR